MIRIVRNTMRPNTKRINLTQKQHDAILERDYYICAYCSGIATTVDHVVPWSWSHCDDPDNLVASCMECNQIASDKMFDNLGLKTAYIRSIMTHSKWRTKRNRKHHVCAWCGEPYRVIDKTASTNIICAKCGGEEYIDDSPS